MNETFRKERDNTHALQTNDFPYIESLINSVSPVTKTTFAGSFSPIPSLIKHLWNLGLDDDVR